MLSADIVIWFVVQNRWLFEKEGRLRTSTGKKNAIFGADKIDSSLQSQPNLNTKCCILMI